MARDVEALLAGLYFAHRRILTAFFRLRGFSPNDSEDLMHDTFVRAWRGIEQLEDVAAKEGWLYRIAHNVYKNRLRSESAQKRNQPEVPIDTPEAPLDLEDPGPDALGELLKSELFERLEIAIGSLPPQMQRCLRLAQEGLSYREIAALLRISEETVRAHLFLARRRLRILLADGGEPPPGGRG